MKKEIVETKVSKKIMSDMVEMFGLTTNQTAIMLSIQKLAVEVDVDASIKNNKLYVSKLNWLRNWEDSTLNYFSSTKECKISSLYEKNDIIKNIKKAVKESSSNAWIYIICLECLAFNAYTPLGIEDIDKQSKKCKYDKKRGYAVIKNFFVSNGFIDEDKIDRLNKTYNKTIDKLSGKMQSLAIKALIVVGSAAIVALATSLAAPEIAAVLVGSQFATLHGMALFNACLALIGGGAIAIGGGGVAAGVATIAGGGALLGLAGSVTAVSVTSTLLASSPTFTLSQSAKLETILKEIIINIQQDTLLAQATIKQLKIQINELNDKLLELQENDKKNKEAISNIKKSLKYMTGSFKDMQVFTSAYEEGKNIEKK